MARFIIHGGRPLHGTFKPVGNKNAALPMLAACLLTDKKIVLKNVPDIEDVKVMLDLLSGLGVEIQRENDQLTLQAAKIKSRQLRHDLCRRVRGSILLAGPLVARHGAAIAYPPGGDIIGRRRIDSHLLALQSLGIEISGESAYTLRRKKFHGKYILMDEASVTATENVMMAACLAPGKTTIYNAACEPHVQDLGLLLQKMGANISGLGTNCIEITGKSELGAAEHTIGPDYIEVGSYLVAAAVTQGQINIPLAGNASWIPIISRTFFRLGLQWQSTEKHISLKCSQKIHVHKQNPSDIPKIEDGIWPAFPSDLMSVTIVLATQAHGTVLFFEKLFESRLYFVDNLISMGAKIVLCDPHRVVISGPAKLHGAKMATPDIRAGMALIIAALCARGQSIIENAHIIDRGYENIDHKLRVLGADIVRVM